MLSYGQVRYEQIVLRAQPQGVSYSFHVGFNIVTLYQRRAGRWTYQSGQHGHGGGFSGAVVAKQNGYLIRLHVHGELVNNVLSGRETLAE